MKIKITEPTRLHLEYLLGKDEKAWAQTIERVVAALSHNYWLRDYFSTYDINAHWKADGKDARKGKPDAKQEESRLDEFRKLYQDQNRKLV